MVEFVAEHLLEIIFGLISAGALAFCKYLHSKLKQNETLMQEQKDRMLEQLIEEKMIPLREDIAKIHEKIAGIKEYEAHTIDALVESYKYRLGRLCGLYMQQGYMYKSQWEQLNEMFKVYSSLGGNGWGQSQYEHAMQLPVHPDPSFEEHEENK